MRLKSTQQLAQRCRKFEDGEVVQESGRPRIRGEANSNRIVFAEYACGSGAAGLEDGERYDPNATKVFRERRGTDDESKQEMGRRWMSDVAQRGPRAQGETFQAKGKRQLTTWPVGEDAACRDEQR
ncbi:unnamed protein product [Fusarium graminearum]|nr:unnamed protein product [Fusarium graminearum]